MMNHYQKYLSHHGQANVLEVTKNKPKIMKALARGYPILIIR